MSCIVGSCGLIFGQYFKQIGGIPFAIILGAFVNNFLKIPLQFNEGIKFCEKKFLNLAIIIMGLDFNLNHLKSLSSQFILSLIALVFIVIYISFLIGKLMRIKSSVSILLGIGNSICGASAIAATSSMITKQKEDIAISITIINILGVLGVFLLPHFLVDLEPYISGALVGGSLQAVGHVVAASSFLTEEASQIALAVKMGRVSLLIPIILIISMITNKSRSKIDIRSVFPTYIVMFVLSVIIANMNIIPIHILIIVKKVNHFILATAMGALGLSLSFKSLKNNFLQSLFLGGAVFTIQLLVLGVIIALF